MSDDEQSEEECRDAIKAENASCVSIEESIEASIASGFLFCEDHVSDISPHLDMPLHYSGSVQQSLNVSENSDIGSDCFELHDLTSDDYFHRCIGVRLHKEYLPVVRATESEASDTWCVHDQVTAVQTQKVAILFEHKERCNTPLTVTVRRSRTDGLGIGERATLGMVGGIAGSGLFALGCIALVGVGWTVAAASVGSLALGGLSGSAVGARRNSGPDAFFSGALAGFVGLTATTAFLGGELVVEACSDASEVEV